MYSVIEKRTKNWFRKIVILSTVLEVEVAFGSVSVTLQREKKFIITFWIVVHTLISQLKPQFNNAETKNSAFSIPRTFSCALDTLLEKKKNKQKTSSLFLPHFKFSYKKWIHVLLFSTCWTSRYCWNYCHFITSPSCFRPQVSLSIIVKCNVSHLGQSHRDRKWISRLTNRTSFYYNAWMISL